jgi:integration host factor subunit beta
MVKSHLIHRIANKQNHLPIKDIDLAVNRIIEKISQTLANNGRIEIRDFGSFSLRYRPPRNAHNPKTGERVYTDAKYSPHFKPGKALRERVNAHYGEAIITHDDDEDEASGGSLF